MLEEITWLSWQIIQDPRGAHLAMAAFMAEFVRRTVAKSARLGGES